MGDRNTFALIQLYFVCYVISLIRYAGFDVVVVGGTRIKYNMQRRKRYADFSKSGLV